ncbi:hypothetical protein [Metabacillus iocasae]|uniref:ABC transporter periplasmic binding protein yphF n=1 Tax=Priestia iocasae TaxID=2291674 RepID=A0ABS2QQI1_9BACI|nr:hypothetical protein [Metabacillus iocasae]MBM7701713.1 hypothetical protein [Metabacillus iocasae]
MKRLTFLVLIVCFTLVLSGCLYPEDKLQKNQIPYKDQIAAVQTVVDQYQQDSGGLLPIKDRDMSTPIYQKYPIDFNKLIPRYMQEAPGISFESGGVFSYVLTDVEENPTVKLIDLRTAEKIREVKVHINIYRQKNKGYAPFKDVIAKGVFSIDYDKLNFKEPAYVVSPFSGNNLPLVMNHEGEVFIDYSADLYNALSTEKHTFKQGDDIRDILLDTSDFVPAYSLAYTIDEKTKEPIFLEK